MAAEILIRDSKIEQIKGRSFLRYLEKTVLDCSMRPKSLCRECLEAFQQPAREGLQESTHSVAWMLDFKPSVVFWVA